MKKHKWIVENRCEVLVLGDVEIKVMGNTYHGWSLVCKSLDITNLYLSSKHFADAKDEALGIIAEEAGALKRRYAELEKLALEVLHGEMPGPDPRADAQ